MDIGERRMDGVMNNITAEEVRTKRYVLCTAALLVVTVAICSFLCVLFSTVGNAIEKGLKETLCRNCPVVAYLKDDTKDSEKLVDRFMALNGTVSVENQSSEESFDQIKEALGADSAAILNGVEPDQFPRSVKLFVDFDTLTDLRRYEKQVVEGFNEIDDVLYPAAYLKDVLPAIQKTLTGVKYIEKALIFLVALAGFCSLLMFTMHSTRSEERSFATLPVVTILAGILALALLWAAEKTGVRFGAMLSVTKSEWCRVMFMPISIGITMQLVFSAIKKHRQTTMTSQKL